MERKLFQQVQSDFAELEKIVATHPNDFDKIKNAIAKRDGMFCGYNDDCGMMDFDFGKHMIATIYYEESPIRLSRSVEVWDGGDCYGNIDLDENGEVVADTPETYTSEYNANLDKFEGEFYYEVSDKDDVPITSKLFENREEAIDYAKKHDGALINKCFVENHFPVDILPVWEYGHDYGDKY